MLLPLRSRRFLLYWAFLLSGAAALVYQISWSRQIGLSFGHTMHAAALTLSAFFAGCAIGYLTGSKLSGRVDPLLGYGVAELAAAGWACAIPCLLGWTESASLFGNAEFGRQTSARGLYSFVLLLPATTALGFTLPMMADALSLSRHGGLSDATGMRRVSLAYSLNTAGALAGALATTFFLLVSVGVTASSYFAAGLSAFSALTALVLYVLQGKSAARAPSRVQPSPHFCTASSWVWISLAALSGFGTLALEVLYTRMFSLVFHNSTYTFGAVVAAFLAALAAGAALAAFLRSRYRVENLLAAATGLGGGAIISSTLAFVWLTDLDYFRFGDTFAQYLAGASALTCVVVAPPIILLGMMLPLLWEAAGERSAGAAVGRLTAANTVAAASGALTASFLLLPGLGLWLSFAVVAAAFSACGTAFCFVLKRPVWGLAGAGAFIGLAASALLATAQADVRLSKEERLVRRWNSAYGWIDLVHEEATDSFRVRQNLHYRFGRTGSSPREFKLAHIPLLLHERPEETLFLGLGTGLTAGAAIPHEDVKSVVAVELIPEVVEAAAALAEHNNGVTSHAKADICVDDARHYLLTTNRRFDVIVADLFVPWESETGYLYTVEHYRIARERLKTGGLYCQWLPMYQVGSREFEMIADSFASVFPTTTLWWGDMDASNPVVALVGTGNSIRLDVDRLESRLDSLRRAAGSIDESLQTSERFFDAYLGDWSVPAGRILNTDERPRLEFYTPISNRNGKMLRGRALQGYYVRVLAHLPMDDAKLLRADVNVGDGPDSRRMRQRFVLGLAGDT